MDLRTLQTEPRFTSIHPTEATLRDLNCHLATSEFFGQVLQGLLSQLATGPSL